MRNRRKGADRSATAGSPVVAAPAQAPAAASPSSGVAGTHTANDYRLSQIGPVVLPNVSSPLGYSYRDNVLYPSNLDRIQALCLPVRLNLDGGIRFNSAAWQVGGWLAYLNDVFWPSLFGQWVSLAEGRDQYKPTTDTLTNNTAGVNAIKVRMLKIVTLKATVRLLWTLLHSVHYNKASWSMYDGLVQYRSRLARLLDLSDSLTYPAEFEPWIQFLAKVFTPYPGGPLCFRWINVEHTLNHTNHQTYQDWHTALGIPDFTSATEVGYMVADCELILKGLTGQHTNANYKTDFRLVESIQNMLGFPTPKTPVSGVVVDPLAFDDIFRGGFMALDNKGAGDDVYVVFPDTAGSEDTLIPIQMNHQLDDLDWKGMKGIVAADHPTQATGDPWSKTTEDMKLYGCVHPSRTIVTGTTPAYKIYTIEDGWVEITDYIDETAVAGPQEWQWGHPVGANHQYAFALSASEESEEWYNQEFARPASVRFQMPLAHINEALVHWLHQAFKVPMVR